MTSLLEAVDRRGSAPLDHVDEGYFALVADQVRRRPAAEALVQGPRRYTYAQLDEVSDRVGYALIERGVQPGEHVGLMYPRSVEWVIGTLGILKAGAVVVALDPVNPDTRIETMTRDAGVRLVCTDADTRLPAHVAAFEVPTQLGSDPASAELTGLELRPPADPDQVTHLIYTSGSSGRPKAVRERLAALTNLAHWTRSAYGVLEGDRASWLSTPGFAVQFMEWLPYLAVGAAVHIPESGLTQTPVQLRDWLHAQQITHTMLVAALAEPVWKLEWSATSALRIMVTTAERVHSWPPEGLPFTVVMTYGTTETTNALTCLDLGAGVDFTSDATASEVKATRPVPVGVPMRNVRAYILSDEGEPCRPETAGHLHISGAGVSAGYHERPDLTESSFLPNPFTDDPHPVLYRTGDLARYRPDGAIEIIGRADDQVKIRGFRVELGEVEAHLSRVSEATQVAVGVVGNDRDRRLVGYVVATAESALDSDDLRERMSHDLPYYMVPTSIVIADELPRLPNGKLDRLALRDIPVPTTSSAFAVARNDTEASLVSLWSSLFGLPSVGVHDNFFALGGHSLLAFQLIDELRRLHRVELTLSDLSGVPTIAQLADLITRQRLDGASRVADLPELVPDPAARYEPFPMTESQQALWIGRHGLVDLGDVGCHGYFEWDSTDLDVDRFTRAWNDLVNRHDALRTIITSDGQQQVRPPADPRPIPVEDLSHLSTERQDEFLTSLRERLAHHVLDETTGPLYDVRITNLGDRHRIHILLDFLIADAWSYFQVLVPDLVAFYSRTLPDPEPLALSFRDYARTLLGPLRDSALYQRSKWYWMDLIEDFPPAPDLPARPADAPPVPQRFQRVRHRIPADVWGAVQDAATRHGVTASGVLAATFAEVLTAWSGQRRFAINFPLFNRIPLHRDVNRICGDTTTTMLLAIDGQGATFADRAADVQSRLWAGLEHRYYSGVQVLRDLTRIRGTLVPAMPVVMTSLAGQPPQYRETELGVPVFGLSQTPQVALDFQIFERDGCLDINWDFLPSEFPDGMVAEMFDALCSLLARLATPGEWDRADLGLVPTTITPPELEPLRQERVAARDTGAAWERYWSNISRTGQGGDVIWDADSAVEIRWLLDQSSRHFDPALPVLDVGCGNGRYTRAFAAHFPHAVGVDVSQSAIDKAHAETPAALRSRVDYVVADIVDHEHLAALPPGPYNVFVRGVFHVLDAASRRRMAEAIHAATDGRGTVIIHEPNYAQGGFGYTGFVGGSSRRTQTLVEPLETAGVHHSQPFTRAEADECFPRSSWHVVTDGDISLHGISPDSDEDALELPGYYCVIRPQHETTKKGDHA